MNYSRILVMSLCVGLFSCDDVLGKGVGFPPKATADDVRRAIADAKHVHPRLIATKEELKGLAEAASKDPLKKVIAETIVRRAAALENIEPVERKLQGKRLLSVSRRCAQRVLMLATAYHLTGDKKYAARAEKEMLAAARFRDWNPSHFLDVGEMTFALAIGYDWLYDQLEEPARKEIRRAIAEKGLKVPFETKFNSWVRARNNWGQVCHGGLTVGALAVMDVDPELAARTVESALKNIPLSMAAFAPNGSYPEGPSYWSYGTSYNVLLIASLESALGTDFGLTAAPGFSETGAYPAMVCGPSGLFFNYADGSAGRSPEPVRLWFASRFQRSDWLWGEKELWKKHLGEAGARPAELSGLKRLALAASLLRSGRGSGPGAIVAQRAACRVRRPTVTHDARWPAGALLRSRRHVLGTAPRAGARRAAGRRVLRGALSAARAPCALRPARRAPGARARAAPARARSHLAAHRDHPPAGGCGWLSRGSR